MWILPLVGYLGMILGFGFLTLAIGKLSSSCAGAQDPNIEHEAYTEP